MTYLDAPRAGCRDLRAVLEQSLAAYLGHPSRIVRLRRHRSPYATSFAWRSSTWCSTTPAISRWSSRT
jgi:hypothetical protein